MSAAILVFDVGGTHMRLALANERGALGVMEKSPTPARPAEAVRAMRDFIAAHGAAVARTAGGVAGMVVNGTVRKTTYLPQWDGFDLSTALARECGVNDTRLYNDAEIAAVGEARRGAGQGAGSVGFVTLSTGVGGALVAGGAVVPHALGFEPGKQLIDYERGRTLESLVSGGALAKEFHTAPEELPQGAFDERLAPLAAGLYNLIRIWSPEVLVLGGALIESGRYPVAAIEAAIQALPVELPPLPAIRAAALGDAAGLAGAALMVAEV